jgi:hypothetical protein
MIQTPTPPPPLPPPALPPPPSLPLWQPPTGPSNPPVQTAWYRTTWFTVVMLLLIAPVGLILMWTRRPGWGKTANWITTAVWVALVVLLAVAGGSSGGGVQSGDSSAAMQQSVMTDGASQLQTNLNSLDPSGSGTITMNDAQCVQTAGTQAYTCLAHYTVTDPTIGLNGQKYLLDITGTCDASASCQWHTDGAGQAVGS